ncbi:MAG TPA: KamA family radical SAM protein [Candidatus Omnitrophota bacterium]|nr:KamA family radical SAM protein [Candidatus Omnitrophota bacterium]
MNTVGTALGVKKLTAEENRVISFFKDATPFDWEDWQWQIQNTIRSKDIIEKLVDLTDDEIQGIDGCGKKLSMAITPYFASLIDSKDPNCPIRLQSIPQKFELETSDGEMADPLAEDHCSPVPGLVHRYPDRVLFLVSEMCAMYCRHCTRSRMVGKRTRKLNKETYEAAFEYIRSNKKIRDVLISGGDPLILQDDDLEYILKNVRSIPHVEFVRLGSRIPVTLPQRITSDLVKILKKYSVWMSIHFNHAKEITKRVKFACELLADNGIPLGSQTVLLKGINDKPSVMKKLMHELLKIRVRPYYIYQCDPITGSKHFRTSVSTGINIMEKLYGFTTGYAIPTFVIDCPGGGGKVPIPIKTIMDEKDGIYTLRNYAGKLYTYQDPK